MNAPSVKIQMMMAWQGRANFLNALLSGPLAVFSTLDFLETGLTWESALISMVLSWVIFKALSFCTFNLLRISIYCFSKKEILADTANAAVFYQNAAHQANSIASQFELTVVNTPEKPIGTYQDHPIFEWIDLQGADEQLHRFSFVGTMDIARGITQPIPNGCILLPPGLVYQVDQTINTPT